MRIKQLIDLLKQFPADDEIRVAACWEDPEFGGHSHDVPLVGATKDFKPSGTARIQTPKGHNTVWLATSFHLEPRTIKRRSKAKPED